LFNLLLNGTLLLSDNRHLHDLFLLHWNWDFNQLLNMLVMVAMLA